MTTIDPDCPTCEGEGVVRRRISVYEPGCGFPHDDIEEAPCPCCSGPDPDYLRDLREEDARIAKEFGDDDEA